MSSTSPTPTIYVDGVTGERGDKETRELKVSPVLVAASTVGWTSPGSRGSEKTLAFLRAEGYLWNGDDASDDLPFIRDTEHGPMVVMPRVNIPQNDLIMWMRPNNPPRIMLDGFKETFDQLYAEGQAGSPKWIEMTLHCHMAGRPTLIPTIRQCIAYAQRHEGVWYARKRDIAEWALERAGKER